MLVISTLPLSEVKARLSEIVTQVQREHERVVLTRNGVPAAVLVSADDLQALEDTLDLLSDRAALEELEEAHREVERGEVVDADTLRARYLTR